MNDPDSGYEQPDSPFESASEGSAYDDLDDGQPEDDGKAFDLWGLRNSEPRLDPHEVGRSLSLDVEWYQHLFCGFLKQSGSEAAEAWQHYIIAMILLADREYGLLSEEEREEMESEQENADAWDDDRV
jgi:hypothetical protein